MDSRTKKELGRITAQTPRYLREHLTKEIVDTSEEELIVAYLKEYGRTMPDRARMDLEQKVKDGAFRRRETIIDEKIAKELETFNSVMVERARRAGKLSDPNRDAWMRDRLRKMAK